MFQKDNRHAISFEAKMYRTKIPSEQTFTEMLGSMICTEKRQPVSKLYQNNFC